MDGPRVVLGILPERNGVPLASIFWRFMELAAQGHPFVEVMPRPVHQQRNDLAMRLLDSDFTHILMLDADHMHPRDVVQRLSRWVVQDPGRQVVSALAFRRSTPYEPVAYRRDAEGYICTMLDWEQGLVRADMIGTACVLIARDVFETIAEPWFDFEYAGNGRWTGEDIIFSQRCADAGIPLWVDTTTVSPHLSEMWVKEDTYRAYVDYKRSGAHADNSTE